MLLTVAAIMGLIQSYLGPTLDTKQDSKPIDRNCINQSVNQLVNF